jgi:predicted ATPase
MLTRLKVNGFKNLVDVDVRFGPFTCIAGVNAAGKSNLFDAIRFLSLLAEKPLVEAARAVRGSGSRSMDIRSLFTRIGDEYVDQMSFEAEMIIPAEGIDDVGRAVMADATLLHYRLTLGWQPKDGLAQRHGGPLRIEHEELVPIAVRSVAEHVGFRTASAWRRSTLRRSNQKDGTLISTARPSSGGAVILRHYPGGRASALSLPAVGLEKSVLSTLDADQGSMAVLAQQEMRSWRVFQLDPARIGEPGNLIDPPKITGDGSYVAAALYRLAHEPPTDDQDAYEAETAVYARVGNRLAQLVDDIRDVEVDLDPAREALTIQVTSRNGAKHSAQALSDGTLRFLALAVLEQQEAPGVYCVEEPENGIHPGRIPALLKLIHGIAMDTQYPIEPGNPLRQVIISTHSPSVVLQVPADSLVMAELWPSHNENGRFKRANFRGLANTWRDPEPGRHSLALGTLLNYLNTEGYRPLPAPDPDRDPDSELSIMDRPDVRKMLSATPSD